MNNSLYVLGSLITGATISIFSAVPALAAFNLPYRHGDLLNTTDALNIRHAPCGNKLVTIPKNSILIATSETSTKSCLGVSKWRKVSTHNGTTGWAADNFLDSLKPVYYAEGGQTPVRVITQNSNLNIRSGSLKGQVIGKFKPGTYVYVDHFGAQITVNGKKAYPAYVTDGHYEGWVDATYLVSEVGH